MPPAERPQTSPNETVVRSLLAAYAARDLDAALALMTDDVELALRMTGRLAGRHEPYVGHEGAREFFADLVRVWDDLELELEPWSLSGDRATVRGRVHARIGTQELHARMRWDVTVRDGLVAAVRQTIAVDE